MKRILVYICVCLLALNANAESVKNLQKKQQELQKQIENTNKMLNQTKKNETATLNKLQLLNKNIKTQRQLIHTLGNEITALDGEMALLSQKRDSLQSDLETYKADYARLVRESHYAQMQQSPLLFVLSSDSFQQMVRRVRYMQEFAKYRQEQVERIERTQTEIDIQNDALQEHRKTKQEALQSRKRQQENLARDEKKHQSMLTQLKKQEKNLGAKLKKQQQQAAQLNKKIDEIVRKQTATKTTLTKEQKLVAGGFEQNKGKLPWPVEKGFISGRFGKQQHPVYEHVITDNKGIYLQTTTGTSARAVYKGEVTSCFLVGNTYAVIVQHGNYRTVYSNLSKLAVKQGDKVETKQKLGTIYSDPEQDNKTELYFQIYQDRTILNPSLWLCK